MKIKFNKGEFLIKEGRANLLRCIETIGGKLYLTDQRLIFESHRFNAQTDDSIIPLTHIKYIKKCWTKLYDRIPLTPNSINISTKLGKEYRFVVSHREEWISSIKNQLLRGLDRYII